MLEQEFKTANSKPSYFHQLNFIRFILAIGVVLFHVGTKYAPFNSGFLNTLVTNSAFRVSFFFFISGFILALVYGGESAKISPREFYRKRFTRIFPLYVAAFIVTLLLLVTVVGSAPKGLVIILHALGLQSWYPGYVLDLNYPTWSISAELSFYLAFPVLLSLINDRNLYQLIFIGIAVWLVQSVQHVAFVENVYDGTKRTQEFIDTFPLWHAPTFFVGMITAVAARRISSASLLPAAVAIIGIIILVLIVITENPLRKYIHNGLLAPLFVMIVTGLYLDRSVLAKFLSHPILSKAGKLSYCIFIFQYPLWLAMTALCANRTELFFYAYLILLLLLSAVVHRYVERPLLKKLRKQD